MRRKVTWGLIIIYNVIRLPLVWVLTNGRIKFSFIQLVSPNVKIAVSYKGSIRIGEKCCIDGGTVIRSSGGEINLGHNIYCNRNCNIVSRDMIKIGSGTTIGPNVSIYDHDHRYDKENKGDFKTSPIIIGENVWVGANAIILRGVTIGKGSVIGAGTIVSKDVPENHIVMMENKTILRKIN